MKQKPCGQLLCLMLLTPILNLGVFTPQQSKSDELPSVFNGKDLTGWKVPPDNVWWTAKDGTLGVKNGPNKKGSVLWTEKEYRNFVMEFEFKMGLGRVDSGIFVRNENDQIQIGESGSLKRDMTASPYIASAGGYPVEADGVKDLLKPREWNQMTIVAKGSNYTVWLNGQYVMNYHSKTASQRGPLGIQLHGGREMAIDYRNLKLAELR